MSTLTSDQKIKNILAKAYTKTDDLEKCKEQIKSTFDEIEKIKPVPNTGGVPKNNPTKKENNISDPDNIFNKVG